MRPFAVQPNAGTGVYKHPGASLAAQGERAQRGLEVGGGPSGFQFVLAASGCSVTNVEPALAQCMLLWKPQAT
jgi:hypothetical protein